MRSFGFTSQHCNHQHESVQSYSIQEAARGAQAAQETLEGAAAGGDEEGAGAAAGDEEGAGAGCAAGAAGCAAGAVGCACCAAAAWEQVFVLRSARVDLQL